MHFLESIIVHGYIFDEAILRPYFDKILRELKQRYIKIHNGNTITRELVDDSNPEITRRLIIAMGNIAVLQHTISYYAELLVPAISITTYGKAIAIFETKLAKNKLLYEVYGYDTQTRQWFVWEYMGS